MTTTMTAHAARPPSLDALMSRPALTALVARHGRQDVLLVAREALDAWRRDPAATGQGFDIAAFEQRCAMRLAERESMHFRPVFNLTGTVLHTNLGRAVMADEAIEAVTAVMRQATNLEYRLDDGARGDRDDHLEALLEELTGAPAATAVNNNAAAVLLVLAALAGKKDVPVSRGELVEIGGSFRIPDIMRRAGARLVEVGTTNRTHLGDYADAIGPRTGAVMRVHASNYAVTGFTAAVPLADLAALCRERGVPLLEDLGSGSLVDLAAWGLPHEPTPRQSIAAGVNLVTFSGDKLLGGPQAGLIVGDKALVAAVKKHPLKRALRLDKMTIAALEATLKLYRDPARLAQRLPTLRLLTRTPDDMRDTAQRVAAALAAALGERATVEVKAVVSQIGSGSQPVERLPSLGIAIRPAATGRRPGHVVEQWADALRALPVPVIGRISDNTLILDLRCLEPSHEAAFMAQLTQLPV